MWPRDATVQAWPLQGWGQAPGFSPESRIERTIPRLAYLPSEPDGAIPHSSCGHPLIVGALLS